MEKLKTLDEVLEIFENTESKWEGDNCLEGLNILKKYAKNNVIEGAGKDVVFSIDVEEAIENGITKEDCEKLALLNWHIKDCDYFACFV